MRYKLNKDDVETVVSHLQNVVDVNQIDDNTVCKADYDYLYDTRATDISVKDLLNKNLVSASQTAEESVSKHSAIKLKNFSFSYDGQRKILDNLSLEIKQGERILILGPSGCGKSSLTLCLNGIIPQLIDGKIEGVLKLEDMDIMSTLPFLVPGQETPPR